MNKQELSIILEEKVLKDLKTDAAREGMSTEEYVLKVLEEFSIQLLEIKNGKMEDNYYKILKNESCYLGDIKYECIVLKRFREKENRETLYYLIPDLDYMFLKIIDSGPERNQKLELLEILSLG